VIIICDFCTYLLRKSNSLNNMKTNKRKSNIVRVVATSFFLETYNASTNQFVSILSLSGAGLSTRNSSLQGLLAIYTEFKINSIRIETKDAIGANAAAGVSQPFFLAYVQGAETPNSISDFDGPFVSEVAGGQLHGIAQVDVTLFNPSKSAVLVLRNKDLVQTQPESWLATENGIPADLQSSYGQIWCSALTTGQNQDYTRIHRITFDISCRNLKDTTNLRKALSEPSPSSPSTPKTPSRLEIGGKMYYLANNEDIDKG
jgi:hypothetical protein